MNLYSLIERCWTFQGLHQTGQREAYRYQLIKDYINEVQEELVAANPWTFNLVREGTLSIVAGTAVYTLNDWCLYPLSFYTTDQSAHKVNYRRARNADRYGLRSSSLAYAGTGPWNICWTPRTTAAARKGTSIASTEGDETFTQTGGETFLAAHVGRMLRVNGEAEDYEVDSITSTTILEAKRKFRGRVTGTGVTLTGTGHSGKRWEIGPPGRSQIQILPTPTVASTLPYRYLAMPKRLIYDDEVPEIADSFHHILWKGALKHLGAYNEDDATHQRYAAEYEETLKNLREADNDDIDSEDGPHYASLLDDELGGLPPDVTFRDGPY